MALRTRTWIPPSNGFWPELHAVGDRIFLAHGNAQVYLAELRWTADGWDLVRWELIDGNRAWNAQWIRPGVLTFWRETADQAIWLRFELDATADTWAPVLTGDDPRLVAGNPRAGNQAGLVAADGHWAAWRADTFRLVYDGQVLGTGKGFGAVAGDWLAASSGYPAPNDVIQTWHQGVPQPAHPCLTPLNGLVVGPDGHLAYGFVDLAFYGPGGIHQRAHCTPWRTEGLGPIIRHPNGTTWVATLTWHDATGYAAVLLRPWPDGGVPGQAGLVVEAAAIHASVLPFGDQWLVATCDEHGDGRLQAVAQATPLQVLKPRVADLGTMYLGYYYAVGRYGDFTPAQNCTVLAIDNFTEDKILPANAPARMRAAAEQAGAIFIGTSFEDLDAMAGRWDLVHGLMLGEHQDTAGIETEARDARARLAARGLPAKPIVATIMPDQVFQAGWRIPAGVDVLGVEIYFDGPAASFGDMRKAALRRVDQVLEHTGDLPVILIAQAYDRNRDAWRAPVGRESLEGIQSALFDAARFHKLAGIWWFAYARNGGVLGLPDVEAWHRAGVAAASRPAGLATAVPPEPVTLAATILSYQPTTGEAPLTVTAVAKVTQGTAATFTWRWRKVGAGGWQVAALNPATDPDHHYVFGEPGDYEIGLVADGPGGPAATGKQRLVTVQPRKEKPMPEPTQRPTITLKTNDGVHYVTAEDGGGREGERIGTGHGHTRAKGVLLARSTDADLGDWQRFEVHPGREAGTVGFKLAVAVATPPNDTLPSGPWVTAEPDGTLVCNRWKPADFVPEAWEAFAVQDLGDGVVALKTAHGFLWCAELGGGREVTATDRGQPGPDDDLGIWQQFTPSEPLTRGGARPGGGGILGKRAGIVRAVGSCLADDDGPFLAVGTSLFPLAYLERNEPDRLDANLAKVAGRVHYVRAFGVVSGGSWEDRVIDPRLGDWEDYLAKATDRCYDDHGIRVHWTIFAGIDLCRDPRDRERIVRRFAAAMAPRAEKVFSVELANEGWQNGFGDSGGPDELRHLCGILRDLLPNLVAITDPSASGDTTEAMQAERYYKGARATFATIHPDRSQNGTGGIWRPMRQPWEVHFLPDIPALRFLDEPIGPRSSVAMDSDPLRLAMLAATGYATGCAAFTLHTGAGVRMGGRADQGGGKFYLPREANLFDVPGFDAILDALVAMATRLPDDCPNWQRQNGNEKFPAYPFDVKELREDRVLRAYAAQSDRGGVIPVLQVTADLPMRARRPMRVLVFDPLTWDQVIDQDLAPGEAVMLHGTRENPTGWILGYEFK